jgi:hypothetical protein
LRVLFRLDNVGGNGDAFPTLSSRTAAPDVPPAAPALALGLDASGELSLLSLNGHSNNTYNHDDATDTMTKQANSLQNASSRHSNFFSPDRLLAVELGTTQ